MPNDKLSQVRLNGVTYDIKDAEALRFGTGGSGNQNEIVVLSDTQGAVIASGTTLDDLYTRIDKATIVENVDDGEWIINIVNGDSTVDLTNYYSKGAVDSLVYNALRDYVTSATFASTLSAYYTKSEVDSIIANIQSISIIITETLPQSGSPNIIYFVPKTQSQNDVYDEYMWINNKWEHIGSTEVDLSDYYTKSQTYSKAEVDSLVSGSGSLTVNVTSLSGYNVTLDKTNKDIVDAFNAGKTVWCKMAEYYVPLSEVNEGGTPSVWTYPKLRFSDFYIDSDGSPREHRIYIDYSNSETNTGYYHNTVSPVEYTEIYDSTNQRLFYTGEMLVSMWDDHRIMTYNGQIITNIRAFGSQEESKIAIVLYSFELSNPGQGPYTISGNHTGQIEVPWRDYTVTSYGCIRRQVTIVEGDKLNGGSVASNNSKFVTGDQVYTADEGVKTWVGQQGYLTSATLPASDTTLATSGAYADSKATGDKINALNNIVLGKNLASNTTYTKDRAIQWSTGLSYASSLIHTAYVDLGDATEIIYPRLLSISEQSTAIFGMAFYNAQYTYISGQNSLTGYETMGYAPTKIEVPANAKYARFSWSNVLPAFWVYDTDDVDYDVTAPEWKTAAIIGNKIDKPVAPTDGQVLTYDTTTGAWVADTLDLSGKISAPASPTAGDVLTYDSTNGWIAAAPPAGGGFVASTTQPQDEDVLWIDLSDDGPNYADGDTSSY